MFAENNKVTENESQLVRTWRKDKFCSGLGCRYGFRESISRYDYGISMVASKLLRGKNCNKN